jgi:predicted permease
MPQSLHARWLTDLVQDVRVGLRTLAHAPSFALTTILILGVGIGLNVTLFQMAHVAVIRPPAVDSPETLARLYRQAPRTGSSAVPYPLTQFVGTHSETLSAVLVEASSTVGWGVEALEQVDLSMVSTNWFSELGHQAAIGRVFSDTIDGHPSAPPVAVLGHHFWRTRLGSDAAIVGTTIEVDRRPFTVVGIASASLPGLDFDVPDVYIPIVQRRHLYPTSTMLESWDNNAVAFYGRFRPGLSRAALRDSLRATMQAAAAAQRAIGPDEWLEPHLGSVNFMDDDDRAGAWAALTLLSGLTLLVLAVAAANLGNLVLSHSAGRVRELAVRSALGACRGRVVRQLVAESLPLTALGAVAAIAISTWIARMIALATDLPAYLDFTPDLLTLGASLVFAAVALAATALLPAWHVARQDLTGAMKDGGYGVSHALDRAGMRRYLLGAQVAGSCLLLVLAGMMARGVQRVLAADVGFDLDRAAVLTVPLARFGIAGDAAIAYWRDVQARVRGHGDVEATAIVTAPPLSGRAVEVTLPDVRALETFEHRVEAEYFNVMKIPLVAGRAFVPSDTSTTVVVSRRLALEMYGSLDVLGRGFPKSQPTDVIVGVAENAQTVRLRATNVAELYRPLTRDDFATVSLVARGRGDAARLAPVLREAAQRDPRVVAAVTLLRDAFERRVSGSRVAGTIASGLAAVALLLACLGIYGVVSYAVALRTREIGIRTALGANRSQLLRTVLRRVQSPVGIGMAFGLAAAIPAGIALSTDPFYLDLDDPTALAGAVALFAVAALTAAIWPAARALGGNPLDALRQS